ncbi:MAG: NAD+ synthase [Bacteriovoracaceae bacterium]
MRIKLHQTQHTLADFEGVLSYLKSIPVEKEKTLHLFPELFLTGYPLKDLCLTRPFIEAYEFFLEEVRSWAASRKESEVFLMGGLEYKKDGKGIPQHIKNVIWCAEKGNISSVYSKRLLPNYDIFDEKKYFSAGTENTILTIHGLKVGLLICEDMWPSTTHDFDPGKSLHQELKNKNESLDLLINLSASPFNIGKLDKRIARATELSRAFAAPFIYVNRVGAEDEVLFDGQSFVAEDLDIVIQAKAFTATVLEYVAEKNKKSLSTYDVKEENTWESLFEISLTKQKALPRVKSLSHEELAEVKQALEFGLQEYASKTGFKKFTVALSGGIDSALVLTLARLSLKKGQSLEAIYMPSQYSATLSYELSNALCTSLGVPLYSLPIKFYHATMKNNFNDIFGSPLEGLANENIQSRLRGALLYTRSNMTDSLVINTSNKSELAVGYSTLYGDSVGALSLIGDLYKTEVFDLARYLNVLHPGLIPMGIIDRAPSAELRENQKDEDSLPPYERLDAILEGILSYRLSFKEMAKMGFEEKELKKVFLLYAKSEYKRYQFCPILKIKAKSFGFGYRIPITKDHKFYY